MDDIITEHPINIYDLKAAILACEDGYPEVAAQILREVLDEYEELVEELDEST